jgi:hypothetical protein
MLGLISNFKALKLGFSNHKAAYNVSNLYRKNCKMYFWFLTNFNLVTKYLYSKGYLKLCTQRNIYQIYSKVEQMKTSNTVCEGLRKNIVRIYIRSKKGNKVSQKPLFIVIHIEYCIYLSRFAFVINDKIFEIQKKMNQNMLRRKRYSL